MIVMIPLQTTPNFFIITSCIWSQYEININQVRAPKKLITVWDVFQSISCL